MTNILLLLALLLVPFAGLRLVGLDVAWRGRISLAAVFLFTGIGHFLKTAEMTAMLPPWVPNRTGVILGTGVLEILAAVALLIPASSRAAGIFLCLFLVAVFPANIHAALERVDFGGHAAGPVYLAVRFPLQLLLLAWTWRFAVAPRETPRRRQAPPQPHIREAVCAPPSAGNGGTNLPP